MLGEQNWVDDLHHVKLITFFLESVAMVVLDGFICFITEIRVLLQELLIDLFTVLTFFDFQIRDFGLSLSRYDVILVALFFSFWDRHLPCSFIGNLNVTFDLSFFLLVSNHFVFNDYRVLNRNFFLHNSDSFMDYVWLIFLSLITDLFFCLCYHKLIQLQVCVLEIRSLFTRVRYNFRYCSRCHLFIIIC